MRGSLLLLLFLASSFGEDCTHIIYCNPTILTAIDDAQIFADSKTFVDMPLLDNATAVLSAFNAFGDSPSVEQLRGWTNQYFDPNFTDVDNEWTPPDWKENPSGIEKILPEYRPFAHFLNEVWKQLGKEARVDMIEAHPDRHTLIALKHPFVAPGGRFRELYYWDSYWILRGLLICDMKDTAQGMIQNLVDMISAYGHVLNGARIYYLNRSQPPLLIAMVEEYYEYTKDFNYVKSILSSLDTEYNYWMTERKTSVVQGYTLNRFNADTVTARPEGYHTDAVAAVGLDSVAQANLFHETASTAETGWDFSTRWMADGASLSTLATTTVIPVDLNAILLKAERTLARFHEMNNNNAKRDFYLDAASKRSAGMKAVLFDTTDNIWYDYWTSRSALNKKFYASNYVPLWAGETSYIDKSRFQADVEKLGLVDFPGGIPSSLINSGQQWDFPSAWPPCNWFMLKAFEAIGENDMAEKLANTWVQTNWKSWNSTGDMFEKYNASAPGRFGTGGEYEVQLGFGWTNGAVLDILATYYSETGPDLGRTTFVDSAASSIQYVFSIFVFLLLWR